MNLATAPLGHWYWAARLHRWPRPVEPLREGYSLLVPVPGDLPAFLDLALSACAAQRHEHRNETIVIPDHMTPAVEEVVRQYRAQWPDPLHVQLLPRPERWVLPWLHSGSRNHGLQLIAGTAAATSEHIILHDADLFPCTPNLLESQYRIAVERGLACYGLSGVWDPWYAEHGMRLAATWDLVARVDWLRSSTPYQHLGHDDTLWGESHTFDTTLRPQALTDAERVDHADRAADFVHFNYVISAYRHYERQGHGYLDDRFLMLLISLMCELAHASSQGSALPNPAELSAALHDPDPPVRFPSPAEGAEPYARFREQIDHLLSSSWIRSDRVDRATRSLAVFDRHYGWLEVSGTGALP